MSQGDFPRLYECIPAAGWPPPPPELIAAEGLLRDAAAIYQTGEFVQAARAFLAAAAVLRSVPAGSFAHSATSNRAIAYRNSALAWKAAGQPADGRRSLVDIDDPGCGELLVELCAGLE